MTNLTNLPQELLSQILSHVSTTISLYDHNLTAFSLLRVSSNFRTTFAREFHRSRISSGDTLAKNMDAITGDDVEFALLYEEVMVGAIACFPGAVGEQRVWWRMVAEHIVGRKMAMVMATTEAEKGMGMGMVTEVIGGGEGEKQCA